MLPGAKGTAHGHRKRTTNRLVDRTGLLGDLKIARRRDGVCQGMRISIRFVGKWWGGIKIISACYKRRISSSSGLNDDMGPVRLRVIPSIRRFVNRSVQGQGCSRTKLTRA